MKKTTRFIIISSLLTAGALVSVIVSGIAMQTGNGELATLGSRLALLFALGMVVYILPRLAGSVRLDALRSDLSFRISWGGWIFLALLVVVALLALGTANNLLYLIVALLAATLLVSEVASRLSLNAVDVRLRFPDHIFAREAARFEVTVHNRKRLLPSFSLTIAAAHPTTATAEKPADKSSSDKSSPDKPSSDKPAPDQPAIDRLAFFPVIPPRAHAQTRFEAVFPQRGVYPVRGFTISTRFPFGFIERRRRALAAGEVVVYPQPQPLDERWQRLALRQGRTESAVRGSGSDLYSIRQYQATDHPRHIDWKATAKTTRLMVREFTREDDWQGTIVFDPIRPPDPDPARAETFAEFFEPAVTMAASLIVHFLDEGAEVRLFVGDEDTGFGNGREHCYLMLALLARVQPEALDQQHAGEPARLQAYLPDEEFRILLTPFRSDELPAHARRAAHVICFEDLMAEEGRENTEDTE